MKPNQNSLRFERLWLGSIALGGFMALLADKPAYPFVSAELMLFMQLAAIASNIALVLYISRKNSAISRVILLITFISGTYFDISSLLSSPGQYVQWLFLIIQLAMETAGIYYLFLSKNSKAALPASLSKANARLLDCALNLLESGKPTEAVTLFNDLIASDPDNADAYCGRGVCFLRLGEKDKGLRDISIAAGKGNIPAQVLLSRQ